MWIGQVFVETSKQYDQDADAVLQVVLEINGIAEQLLYTIQQMRQAIEEITNAQAMVRVGQQILQAD